MPNMSHYNFNTNQNAQWQVHYSTFGENITTNTTTVENNYTHRFRDYHGDYITDEWDLEITDHALEESAEQFRRHLISCFGTANIDTNTVKVKRKSIDVEFDDECVRETLIALDQLIINKKNRKREVEYDINVTEGNMAEAPSNKVEQFRKHIEFLHSVMNELDKEIAKHEKLKENLLVKNKVMEVLTFEKKVFSQCYNLIHDKLISEYDVLEYYPSLYRTKKEKNNRILGKFKDLGREDHEIRLTAV